MVPPPLPILVRFGMLHAEWASGLAFCLFISSMRPSKPLQWQKRMPALAGQAIAAALAGAMCSISTIFQLAARRRAARKNSTSATIGGGQKAIMRLCSVPNTHMPLAGKKKKKGTAQRGWGIQVVSVSELGSARKDYQNENKTKVKTP